MKNNNKQKSKKVNTKSEDIFLNELEKFKDIFPQFVVEGENGKEVDFDALKIFLDKNQGINEEKERYNFTWNGKQEAFKNISKPSFGTLKPRKGESVDFDKTENIFIEGDNLEVLKLLQANYRGKIKMIYIDPPYNTGKDFIYKDNFKEGINEYYEKIGDKIDGIKTTTNPDSNGRYHSAWLSMMYPRLFLAKQLLKDDGVIFTSIDDNEQYHLRMLMNEIFGEENFIGTATWEKRTKAQNTETAKEKFQQKTEYIFIYKKFSSKINFNLEVTGQKEYKEKDNKGVFRFKPVEEMSAVGMRGRETMIYPILGISPGKDKQWKVGRDYIEKFIERDDIVVIGNKPNLKIRPTDEATQRFKPFWSHFFEKEVYGTAESGKSELTELLGTDKHEFETVKPVKLITKLFSHIKKTEGVGLEKNDTILDFFAGSATTGHAVMNLNKDGGNRKFILVQLPEEINESSEAFKVGYKKITEISKDRLKKAIEKNRYKEGFKVFTLGKSNYKIWKDYDGDDVEKLKEQMKLFKESPLEKDWNEESLVYEILLKEGFSLNSKVENKKDFWVIENKIEENEENVRKIFIDFSKKIDDKKIEKMKILKTDLFVCFDSALDDSQKINFGRNFGLKVI